MVQPFNLINFSEEVKNTNTFWELHKKTHIGIKRLKKLIVANKLDISHFTPGKYKKLLFSKENRKCPICNIVFETFKRRKKKTCSRSCANTYFRAGEKHPNWKPYSERPRKGDVAKRICLKYHKKECIICKESLVIDIHHYDENCSNNLPENLIPLCPTHHRYMHNNTGRSLIKNKVDEYYNSFKYK